MENKNISKLPDNILEKISGGTLLQEEIAGFLYTASNLKASGDSLDSALELIHSFPQFSRYTPEEIAYLDDLIISNWDKF